MPEGVSADEGRAYVDAYGDSARFRTPLENPYVRKILEELGLSTPGELLEDDGLITRDFSAPE